MRDPLTHDYLLEVIRRARAFSGCWDAGTSGKLAADAFRCAIEVQRLQAEVQRLKAETARRENTPYWLSPHD